MTNLIVNNTQGSSDCKSSEKVERIPRIIHYCWVGRNPLPPIAKKYIASWKKFCPDYKIIEWNEDNFDINYCAYTREAYDAKKWAFVSDVVRLYALVNYGGIYMDTDVEVIKPLDDLLKFHAVSGFELEKYIPTGLMACEKGHPAFVEFLKEYDGIHFIKPDGTQDTMTNVKRITAKSLEYGLIQNNSEQTLSNGFHILPRDYLCPEDWRTGAINITSNTYTIHHFEGSWMPEEARYSTKIYKKLIKLHCPKKLAGKIAGFAKRLKFHGLFSTLHDVCIYVVKKFKRKK